MRNPLLKRNYSYQHYNVTLVLIVLNVVVFLITTLSPRALYSLALSPVNVLYRGAYYEFITYMFSQASIMQILFNMLGLFFFGFQVERRMGSSEFLAFYLISGIGAGLISFAIYILSGTNVYLVGASGAVFAVLLAYATFFPDSMIYVMGILPIRAPILVLIYTGIEIFSQIFGFTSGIAHLTHLAGFLIAYFYLVLRIGVNPFKVFFRGQRW